MITANAEQIEYARIILSVVSSEEVACANKNHCGILIAERDSTWQAKLDEKEREIVRLKQLVEDFRRERVMPFDDSI